MPLTPEQLDILMTKASDRKARAAEFYQKTNIFSTVYIPQDNIFTRFYTDSDAEYIRSIWRHKFDKLNGQCLGPRECEICAFLNSLPDWDAKWQFGSREIGISYAWIDEYSGPASPYMKVQEPILLMGNWKLNQQLSAFISDLGTDEMRDFFNPGAPYFRMRMYLRDRGKTFDFMPAMNKRISMPPLPDHYPPLSQCIYGEHEGPSEAVIEKFEQAITRSYEAPLKLSEKADPPWNDDSETSKAHPEQPSNCPAAFGQKPLKFAPACLPCMIEEECFKATQK